MKCLLRAFSTVVLCSFFICGFNTANAQSYVTNVHALDILEELVESGESLNDVINFQSGIKDASENIDLSSRTLAYEGLTTDRAFKYERSLIFTFMELLKLHDSVADAISEFEGTHINVYLTNSEDKAKRLINYNTAFVNNLKPHLAI